MLQLLEISFLDFLSFTQIVNLIPNNEIIGNPTTFSYKTLLPRMIILNPLFLASVGGGEWGGRKKRRQRGNRLGSGRQGECLLIVDLSSGTGTNSWTSIFSTYPALTLPDDSFFCFCSILEAICLHSRWYQPPGSLLHAKVTHSSYRVQYTQGCLDISH